METVGKEIMGLS